MTQSASGPAPLADLRHALVVGADPGIGAAVAGRFAAEGYRLTLVARDRERLRWAQRLTPADGGAVQTIVADARDPYELRTALAPVCAAGSPGVVLYNEALLEGDELLASDERRLESAYAVNVVGAIVCAQLAVPGMRAAHSGTLLFTGGPPASGADPVPSGFATLSLGRVTMRAVAQLLADELAAVPVHVATVDVGGPGAPTGSGAPSDAARIAELCWTIHREPPDRWQNEYRFESATVNVVADPGTPAPMPIDQ